jgi:hypothetical protein
MTNESIGNLKAVLNEVCNGDIQIAQKQARQFLRTWKTDSRNEEAQKARLIELLNKTQSREVDVPYLIKDTLFAEDASTFPEDRYLVRKNDAALLERIFSVRMAAHRLAEYELPYLPAFLLYGESGCGKTMFARYVAYKADVPFICVRFSKLVTSELGGTQNNLAQVFGFAQRTPCVLCFDEIDAIGLKRGQMNDFGELNRIVIAMMQEIDRLPGHVILCGTTNRYDMLDPALVRRFPIRHEMMPLSLDEKKELSRVIFNKTDMSLSDEDFYEFDAMIENSHTAAEVVNQAIEFLALRIYQGIISGQTAVE